MIVTKKRSITKSITWRFLGSLDTFLLSSIIINYSTQNYSFNLAFYIAGLEIITKTFLYYFHERIWNRVNWGRIKSND